MKVFRIVLVALFLMTQMVPIFSQDNSAVPKRTPEQEAIKQTEKLQQELDLNLDQSKQVYEINLRYARERQISNKRSEAMERMKNKNADIQRVLSPEQNFRLQTKRYERTYFETNTSNRNQTVNSSRLRSSSGFQSHRPVRVPGSSTRNTRNNYRPVNPDFHPGVQRYQSTRPRSTDQSPNRYQNNSFLRSSPGNSSYTPGRTETTSPSRNSSAGTNNPTRTNYTPGRTESPSNTTRK